MALKPDNSLQLPVFRRAPGAIAIDLDGTLLNSRSQLSDRNRSAINQCLARGIPVILATARTVRSVRRLLGDELTQSCSLVLQNGSLAKAAPPLKGNYKEEIPESLAREIIDLVLRTEPEARVGVEINGYEFGTSHPREAKELWEHNSATPDMQLSLEQALPLGPGKIFVGLNRDLSHIIKAISLRLGESLSLVPSDGFQFLNITLAGATKPKALQKLLGSGNIALKDVIAFGDDFPDIEMLRACGTSIAMANAIPEVKAVCTYHTLSNDSDGVAAALERMLAETG
jgi:Cof subfamily protein (haloacid dehalogenase superfamily)